MPDEEPLSRIENLLRQTPQSDVQDAEALADRDIAIRELQYIHDRIMVEVDKVAAAQQQRNNGEVHALINTVDRIVSGRTED